MPARPQCPSLWNPFPTLFPLPLVLPGRAHILQQLKMPVTWSPASFAARIQACDQFRPIGVEAKSAGGGLGGRLGKASLSLFSVGCSCVCIGSNAGCGSHSAPWGETFRVLWGWSRETDGTCLWPEGTAVPTLAASDSLPRRQTAS